METDNIETLRKEMFDTLRKLKDKSLTVEQARAIVEVGKVIVDTAKAETDYLRATGRKAGTSFVPSLSAPNGHPKMNESYTGKLTPGGF